MILIVESGSTKCEWAFLKGKTIQVAETSGINPTTQLGQSFFFDANFPKPLFASVKSTYFYGAGVNSDEAKLTIKTLLHDAGITGHVEIHSDLLAAARSCCYHDQGLVGILGTGSNTCFYDGNEIHQKSPALGYVLGDEGSGFHIGKEVLRSYFYHFMPEKIRLTFEQKYEPYLDEVLENTYKKSGNNAYIASFAGFLTKIEGEWKSSLLQSVFNEFVVYKILPYGELTQKYPLHLVGSIAFLFQKEISLALQHHGLTATSFVQKPLDNLIHYHGL